MECEGYQDSFPRRYMAILLFLFQVPDGQTGAEYGWMGGEREGQKGWFPKDYVEKLPDSEQSSQNFAIQNSFPRFVSQGA